jgi:hypothetical protein
MQSTVDRYANWLFWEMGQRQDQCELKQYIIRKLEQDVDKWNAMVADSAKRGKKPEDLYHEHPFLTLPGGIPVPYRVSRGSFQ